MSLFKLLGGLLFLILFLFAPDAAFAQITSDAEIVPTQYSSGPQDNIHVFCIAKGDLPKASLTATVPNGESLSFEWRKYNSGNFDLMGNTSSTISGLENGYYQVKITSTSGVAIDTTFTAWVFNNYIEATAEIPLSDCNSFTLKGDYTPKLEYIDLPTGLPKELDRAIEVKWLAEGKVVALFATSIIYDPPAKDTKYTFEVTDRFGCVGRAEVTYLSIVTKASFTYKLEPQGKGSKPDLIEAPFTISFTNTSENGDADKYEWYIFKDLQKIKDEIEAGTFKDSIQEIKYTESLIYTFEEVGEYKVKLVSKKVTAGNTCTDTVYIDKNIIAEVSIIEAPNVFTPDGNGKNDKFVVKFFSMKTVKISIFNRWGKILHTWESNDVRGFYNTTDTVTESVWDGKVGGKVATPGVYYYVVEGTGRDGKRRTANGFFHLFRGK